MVNFEKKDDLEIVSFTVNKINALITDEIRELIIKIFENPNSKVIIDLTGVKYIDSSGFCFLLSVMKVSKNNYGMLKIANVEPSVQALFETLHLNTIFEIYTDIEECVRSFR